MDDELGNKLRIAVIDDEQANLNIYRRTLSDAYEVDEYLSAQTFVNINKETDLNEKYNLIISDYEMSEMSGKELIIYLKKDINEGGFDYKHPVFIITGIADKDEIDIAIETGAHYVIKKPFSPNELLETVNAYIKMCE